MAAGDPDAGPPVGGPPAAETFDGVLDADPGPAPSIHEPDVLTLIGVLGEGGMGTVHEAREPRLLRTVAVKSAREPRFARQLEREALVLSALEHPHIVPVYALQPGPRLVLRKIGGASWDTLLHDPVAARAAARGEDLLAFHVRVLMAVCDAVQHAHSRGILHRDLKPENVMIGEHGQIYVLDWGLAVSLVPDDPRPLPRAADQKGISGTPAFMAPEQCGPGALTVQTDVYGLGAILHEILTGTVRNPGADASAQLLAASDPQPVEYGPEVDELLGALANRMTAAHPSDRPASAAEVREALVRWQQVRVSVDLTRRAKEQIKIARRARKGDGASPLVLDLTTEAITTLRQALDLWSDNRRADEALQRALAEAFDLQLGLGNLELAESLLTEIDDTAELQRRLDDAREALAEEARDVEALRSFARDHDFSADGGSRALAGIVSTVPVIGSCVALAIADRLFGPLGYRWILPGVGIFAAMLSLAIAVLLVRGNLRSRRIGAQFATMVLAVTAHWIAAAWLQLPIHVALAWNCLIAGGLLFAVGLSGTDRPARVASVPYALAFVGIVLVPQVGWELFALGNAVSYVLWTALQGAARDTGPLS
ncbi:MAG: protein kinase [Myxococcota bacterium]